MTEREFLRIRDFLKSKYGIDMSHKKTIMEGRLENYVKGVGYNSYDSYMDALESDITGELEKRLVDILTTNHTYFMREPEHFDFFKGVVLPWIKKKMHAIFLRNVLIYFDDNTKLSILKKIYDCLEPGGYLFLGKTETINRQVVPFKLVSPAVFRK